MIWQSMILMITLHKLFNQTTINKSVKSYDENVEEFNTVHMKIFLGL